MLNFLVTYWGPLLFFATMLLIVAQGAWHALRQRHMGPFWIGLGLAVTLSVAAIVLVALTQRPV